jgi:hypothetical protein
MYGFEAIEAANGWAISLAGSGIVFAGLVVLAILISYMEKALNLWDKKGELLKYLQESFPSGHTVASSLIPQTSSDMPSPLMEIEVEVNSENYISAQCFELIIQRLGEPFSLMRLLEHADQRGIYKPHSHLDTFLKLDLISECGEDQKGLYFWRKNVRLVIPKDEAY